MEYKSLLLSSNGILTLYVDFQIPASGIASLRFYYRPGIKILALIRNEKHADYYGHEFQAFSLLKVIYISEILTDNFIGLMMLILLH